MPNPKAEITKSVDAVRKMREAAKQAAAELEAERVRREAESHPKG